MFSSPRNREEYLSSSVLDWIAVVFDGVGRGGDAATVHATGKIRVLVISVHRRDQSMALLK